MQIGHASIGNLLLQGIEQREIVKQAFTVERKGFGTVLVFQRKIQCFQDAFQLRYGLTDRINRTEYVLQCCSVAVDVQLVLGHLKQPVARNESMQISARFRL